MKKILTMLVIAITSITLNAQDYKDKDYHYYDDVESYKELSISAEQKRRIIEIKKNIGRRHAAIGKSGLRGYEKGEAHRKLNREIRQEIDKILDSSQREIWSKRNSGKKYNNKYKFGKNYQKWSKDYGDIIDDKIDDVEDYYEALIDAVEDDKRLPKDVRKARKEALKQEMKAIKKELKREKKAYKNSKYN